MANVVTTASTVTCGHGAGEVTLTSAAKLRVGADPVVLAVSAAPVSDCTTAPDPNASTRPCTTATADRGFATKLRVGDSPVLLDTVSGTTDGTVSGVPQTALKWTAPPTKLQAS